MLRNMQTLYICKIVQKFRKYNSLLINIKIFSFHFIQCASFWQHIFPFYGATAAYVIKKAYLCVNDLAFAVIIIRLMTDMIMFFLVKI